MNRKMRDERAVQGAAAEAAKMYFLALAVLGVMAAVKLFLILRFDQKWIALLVEITAIPAGLAMVLAQRIRYALWGRMDAPMTEVLNMARARAFDAMCKLSILMMILGFVLEDREFFWYQLPCVVLNWMRSHLLDRCVKNGWLHGLVARSKKGKTAILRALAIFVFGTAFLTGVLWLKNGKMPEVSLIVFGAVLMALAAIASLFGNLKDMNESEAYADAILKCEERRAEREAGDDAETE